jgi:hypothetical protein
MSDPTKFQSNGPIIFDAVSNVASVAAARIGTRVTVDGNDYIYVYNAGNSQISVGQGAIVSAATNYSVTVSSVVSGPMPIGVCLHATLTTDTYGWLLTRGFGKVRTVNALAIGDLCQLGLDGNFENVSGATGGVAHVYGKAMSACASGTATGPAYWNIF